MKEYFSHDYNARHDKKIAALVGKYKGTGYGIFWATCEMMHEEGGELELDDLTYSAISKNINEDENLLKNVIEDCIEKFKLFFFLDGKITSNRVKKNLNKRLNISVIRSKAGKAGANAKQTKANAMQSQAKNALKESKEKEKKVNNINMPIGENFNGLPPETIKASKEIVRITGYVNITDTQVIDMWEVFKIQNLTGKKYYADDEAVYSHFINWIKKQDFKKDSNSELSDYEKSLKENREKARSKKYD